MLRFWGFVGTILGGFLFLLVALRLGTADCGALCWASIEVGTPAETVREFVAIHAPQTDPDSTRYEWGTADRQRIAIRLRQGITDSIYVHWQDADPATRPRVGHVLLMFGAPHWVRLEGTWVANVRTMTMYLMYEEPHQITFVTLRRISNDPATFGEFRILPDDRIMSISRYPAQTTRVVEMPQAWRGFGRYDVLRVCC